MFSFKSTKPELMTKLVLLFAVPGRVLGTGVIYDGGAGCKGYGFNMNAFWLDCGYNQLCKLEDGSMKVYSRCKCFDCEDCTLTASVLSQSVPVTLLVQSQPSTPCHLHTTR